MTILTRVLAVVLLLLIGTAVYGASSEQNLGTVEFNQNVGARLPGNVRFRDDNGDSLELSSLARDKPLVLVLSWFECPNLCPMLLDKMAEAVKDLPFEADSYNIAAISIDPDETLVDAGKVRHRLAQKYGEVMTRWYFLTGEPDAIAATADTVGFQYAYDAELDSYAHPAGFIIVSPGGTVNRYLFGINPDTLNLDLKLALLDAGKGKLGSPIDQVVLRCYRFNPDSGQYNLAVMRLLQGAGGTFIIAMVVLIWWMRRRHADG